jgi:hypothetical protein
MKDDSNEEQQPEGEDTIAGMYEDIDSDPWEEWGDSVKDESATHEVHASRSLNEASNDEDQDQDQDEGKGKGGDEDENNEQQDFGDRDEEAMDDDDILDKEGFADLWDSAQQLWGTYMPPVYLEYRWHVLIYSTRSGYSMIISIMFELIYYNFQS